MMHVSGQPPITTRPSFLPIAMFACLDHQPFDFPLVSASACGPQAVLT